MSTRSRIGYILSDGSVESVYHHFDGYPEWLGVKLVNDFANKYAVRYLMSLGDISSLESYHDWNSNKLNEPIIRTYAQRGEDCPSMFHRTEASFHASMENSDCEYSYLWKDNEWHCYTRSGRSVTIPVS